MKQGKVSETVLKRSILKQIHTKRPETVSFAEYGEGTAAVAFAHEETVIFSTNPRVITSDAMLDSLFYGVVNDVYAAGAEPAFLLCDALYPVGIEEIDIKNAATRLSELSDEANADLIGGHTEITDAVNEPVLVMTVAGKLRDGLKRPLRSNDMKSGETLILTKDIALEGTAVMAFEHEAELTKVLPGHLVDEAKTFLGEISIKQEAALAVANGASSLYNLSTGGVFGGLWEMAEAAGVGLEVDLKAIPIRQHSIEICEILRENPYQIRSNGSLLISVVPGERETALMRALHEAGIPAEVIGHTTGENARIIHNGEEVRYLDKPR